MVDEVISPLQEAGCFGVDGISCAVFCPNFWLAKYVSGQSL